MKKLLTIFFLLLSIAATAQTGSLSQSVYKSRVNDTTSVAFTDALTAAVTAGYGYFFWNNQATTPHYDWYTDSGVQHIFSFGTGTGSGGSSFNHLTPSVKTTNYTATAADTITHLYFRHLSTPMTLTLPGAATIPVGRYVVATKDTTANVTIVGASGVDVIGTATLTEDKETSVWHHRESGKWVRVGGAGGGGVGLVDGDYTDITVSGTGTVMNIDAGVVTGTEIASSVALAGNPTTTTQSAGNNSTRIATTAYADALVANSITNGVTASAPNQDQVFDALALKAPLASPTFTGTPAAPTASANNNSTQIATTAYADAKVADALTNGVTTVAPSQNAVFDAIAAITPIDYTRQPLTVSASTTNMDFSSLTYRSFDITATQSAAFAITFSNATNIVESRLTMRLTGSVAITLPSSVVMQQYETINGRWNTSTNVLTLIGSTATPFLLTFYSDGTNMICSASDPTE
jgi:hypothetical protein